MNKIFIHLFLGVNLIFNSQILLSEPVLAQKATRIQFAKGSYCGSYSGNFSRGRTFVLNLRRGQRFTSRNIGGGTQYDLSMNGPRGNVSGTKVASDQIDYYIPANGDYYIYIVSSTPNSNVEFCAY